MLYGHNYFMKLYTVEPLYNEHLWDPMFCQLYRGVPNSGASGIFPVGMVLHNPVVEYNMAALSEQCTLAGRAKQRLVL